MWKQDWSTPPENYDEMFAWRVYTRVWMDVGLRPPGQWVVMWMKLPEPHGLQSEAIQWYINECKE